jgi:hypothetical protein
MVEISKSGSGEGLGRATGPGYSTVLVGACLNKIHQTENGLAEILAHHSLLILAHRRVWAV